MCLINNGLIGSWLRQRSGKLFVRNITGNLARLTGQIKGIIGSVLSPACRVWLRSQVSQVDELSVDISGGSRQILGGAIPRIGIVAVGAVYQGLCLGSIDLIAENIRVNLPQVLRGQPLRLLEAIAVSAVANFSEADLQASLAAPLLSQAITDLLKAILDTELHQINWQHLRLAPQTLVLQGEMDLDGVVPIEISMGINIRDGRILDIDPLKIVCPIALPGRDLTSHQIDLGEDVQITQLSLMDGLLVCRGQIQVNP